MQPIQSQPQPQPAAFRPCFIVGCERSGTTLLAVLLDRHSTLAVTPETHFLLRMLGNPRGPDPAASTHRALFDRLLSVDRTRDLGLDMERLLARFQTQPPTPRALFQAMLEEYAAIHHKPRAGEKTPFHLWYVPRLVEWFPEGRIVGIVRDGRDVVRSVLQVPWTVQRRLRPHCLTWIHGARATKRFAEQYPRHFLVIRYEDLLAQPEKTLRTVDDFLGLPFEPAQLALQSPTGVVPAWENSWKGKALQPLDASRIGDWKRHVSDHERLVMNSMMRRELIRFGYGDTELPPCSLAQRAWEQFLNLLCRARLYRLWYNIAGRYSHHAVS